MFNWGHVVGAACAGGLISVLLIAFIYKWCCHKERKQPDPVKNREENMQGRSPKTLQGSPYLQIELSARTSSRGIHHLLRHGNFGRPMFNWADHPSLVTEAVEYGWSRFGFTDYNSALSTRSPLSGFCSEVGEHRREEEVEISWEVSQDSVDFMQKIRLNPGLAKVNVSDSYYAASSVIRTALPLPGPYLGNISFPQEAFFEITILGSYDYDHEAVDSKVKEGERVKLIQEGSNGKSKGSDLFHVSSFSRFEEKKVGRKDASGNDAVKLSIGLATGGPPPMKLPGSYRGSIGFNSNGSVCLDGIKLVFESEKEDWAKREKVIGCGFDPRRKKVFFTVDSELKHVIHCKTEEFGSPLYPTLAANSDVMVLVNFGQCPFKYEPANAHRTPNPCFVGPITNSHAATLGYEDSKELFSMGRIDSRWYDRSSAAAGSQNNEPTNNSKELDSLSEADLFEIVLEKSGRSPNTIT